MNKVGILLPPPIDLSVAFESAKKAEGFNDEIVFRIPRNDSERVEVLGESLVLITGDITKNELDVCRHLEFIQVPFAGVDNFDIKELLSRKIMLANVHANATAVAEYSMGLLLVLAKGFVQSDRDLRKGYWHGWMGKEFNIEIQGKTLCIIGVGNIGKKLAYFAKAFGMHVIGVKRAPEVVENVDEVYETKDLLKAVSRADFVVSILPLTDETKGLINRDVFNAMKDKYFINVGRGPVVSEEDLFVALKNRVIRGAAIDTWWNYPEKPMQFAYPSKYPFHALDNIVMVAHAAGFSADSVRRNWEDSVRNVVRFFQGKELENVVTEKGY